MQTPVIVVYGYYGLVCATLGWQVAASHQKKLSVAAKNVYASAIGEALDTVNENESIEHKKTLPMKPGFNYFACFLSVLFVCLPFYYAVKNAEEHAVGVDYFVALVAYVATFPSAYLLQYSIWSVKNVYTYVKERMDALSHEKTVEILSTRLPAVADWWRVRVFEQTSIAPVYLGLAKWSISVMFLTDVFLIAFLLHRVYVYGFVIFLQWPMAVLMGIASIVYSSGLLMSVEEAAAIYVHQQNHIQTLQRVRHKCSMMLLFDETKEMKLEEGGAEYLHLKRWKENLDLYSNIIEQSQEIIERQDVYASIFGIPVKPNFLNFVIGYLVTAIGGLLAKAILDFLGIEIM
eukprot:g8167.t1